MELFGLEELWRETFGDPNICIAVLDGLVDLSHPSLVSANLSQHKSLIPTSNNKGEALAHGTHVTSVIFGQHNESIKGISPNCRGVVIPIFSDGVKHNSITPCSQLDLARAIDQAMQEGAQIINISGGEISPSGSAHPILANVVQKCVENNILIVSAAGNDGCECLQVPSSLPSVLAVGAVNAKGLPLNFSNWGKSYQTQGIVTLGENVPGASPRGGITKKSGTSYATPIISGIAALLLSIQLKRGEQPNPNAIRKILLNSAIGCDDRFVTDCRKILAGRLNIKGAMFQIINGENTMSNTTEKQSNVKLQTTENTNSSIQPTETKLANAEVAISDSNTVFESSPRSIQPSTTSTIDKNTVEHNSESKTTCKTCASSNNDVTTPLVFVLGQLGFDFGTVARRDSIMQHMDQPANPNDPKQWLSYIEKNPWDAASILWTINVDATPIYAIQAQGAFAREVCERLCEFLNEQTCGEVERVSVPGYIGGSVRLSNGQTVPVIWPDLRGMYSWNTKMLAEAVCGDPPLENALQKEKDQYIKKAQSIVNFLQRIYEELRSLGTTSQERAINYAATNAFQAAEVFNNAIESEMELDTIDVERSPICRPESDCWDVKLTFFNPSKMIEQARKIYRFTVDVSDVVPVMVGSVRSWFVR